MFEHPEVGCSVRDSPDVPVRDCPLSLVWQGPSWQFSWAHVGVRRSWLVFGCGSVGLWLCGSLCPAFLEGSFSPPVPLGLCSPESSPFSALRAISHPGLCLEHISVPVFVSSKRCPEIKQEDSCCVPAADVTVGSIFPIIPSVLPAAPCAFLWKDFRKLH